MSKESYRIPEDANQEDMERRRLHLLGRLRDAHTRRILERVGVPSGGRCLDVGAGAGSISRFLAEAVGPEGRVVSTDIDIRFNEAGDLPNVDVRQHDITAEPVDGPFDLIHARAVLQHLAQRDDVLDQLIFALAPGGVVVIEDVDWAPFADQPLPPAFKTVSQAMTSAGIEFNGWDPYYGRRLVAELKDRGLVDVDAEGDQWAMKGGTDSAEWYVLALERAGALFVEMGILDEAELQEALTEARDPDFVVLSPLAVVAWGRRA